MRNGRKDTRLFARVLSIISALYISAFAVGLPVAAQESGVSIDEARAQGEVLARQTKVWSENCSRCHNVRWADELTDTQWKPVIMHMRIRAGLTGQEARDVLEFYRRSN